MQPPYFYTALLHSTTLGPHHVAGLCWLDESRIGDTNIKIKAEFLFLSEVPLQVFTFKIQPTECSPQG